MNDREKYMRMAIGLAKRAEGMTSPNPLVGAVIVKNDKVAGKGYHKMAGFAHAEIAALSDAGEKAKNGTLYVTLEPCDHFGRTPPCTEAIINSGIRKVVVGMKDPNPINNGRGIRKLKNSGISVEKGVLEKDCAGINCPYIKFITKKLPYVTVKAAMSLDGKIATRSGESRWITSEESRKFVQKLRGYVDAVMVGVNTVAKDDPVLLCKLPGAKQPVRVIVDSELKISLTSKLLSTAHKSKVIIATTGKASLNKIRSCEEKSAEVLVLKSKNGRVPLKGLLKSLANMGIVNLLVEGGGGLIAGLVEERLVDRFLFFIAPKIIGGRDAITAVEGGGVDKIASAVQLKNVKVKRFGPDILIEAEIG